MGYGTSRRVQRRQDLSRELASSWQFHRDNCPACGRYDGHSATLGHLCLTGADKFKRLMATTGGLMPRRRS